MEKLTKEQRELLNQVGTRFIDPRIGNHGKGRGHTTTFDDYKKAFRSIMRYANLFGGITERQEDYLRGMLARYESIKELNASYPREFRGEVVQVLQELYDIAQPFTGKHLNVRTNRSYLKSRRDQIANGEFFWDSLLYSAPQLVETLKTLGVDVGNLEERVERILDVTSSDKVLFF